MKLLQSVYGARWLFGATLVAALFGCGGADTADNATFCAGGCQSNAVTVIEAPFAASGTLANQCTATGQKQFIRSYLDEAYLWFNEIPKVDSSQYALPTDYFKALLVPAPKDKFSFVIDTRAAQALSTGSGSSYGAEWLAQTNGSGQTQYRVSFVHANSPAALAGMRRGGVFVKLVNASEPYLYPQTSTSFLTFDYLDSAASTATRTITLTATTLQTNPVPLSTPVFTPNNKKVGYILFNEHNLNAQDKLITAINQLQAQSVSDWVLDMRYNRGGYLFVANTLASMLAGTKGAGKTFEKLQFSSKRQADNLIDLFHPTVQYTPTNSAQFAAGAALPQVSANRVFVLTSGSTCSASESVINALRGVDVEVVLIGGTTCGKPYGFTEKDNCGKSYFPIEFQGVNHKNFGAYENGFAPTCAAADDLDKPLGLNTEKQLASALRYVDNGQCDTTPPAGRRLFGGSAPQPAHNTLPADVGLNHPNWPGRILWHH